MCKSIDVASGEYLVASYNILHLNKLYLVSILTHLLVYLQNVPPALLVRFLREHRSEWADYGVDAYSAASLKGSPYAVPCARPGGFPSSQVILPLAHTVEHEEVKKNYYSKKFLWSLPFTVNMTMCLFSFWRWFGWRALHSPPKTLLWLDEICSYCRLV